jgi:transketolase
MEIVIPGTPEEFDRLFRETYSDAHPTYFRLSERSNQKSCEVVFSQATIIRNGTLATVIAVGPTLANVLEATKLLDVTILYYTTVAPFDGETLRNNCCSGNIAVIEPCYEGTLSHRIMESLEGRSVRLLSIGVPHVFLTGYGHADEHDLACGLTSEQIRARLEAFLDVSA